MNIHNTLDILYYTSFFVIGICIGSFANVLIYRLPAQKNIAFPSSHCQSCNTPLKWYHNVPIISWIFLRGKCAFCNDKINIQYPLIELFSGIIGIIALMKEDSVIKAFLIMLCFIVLLALCAIDFRYKAVPDSLLITAVMLSFLYALSINGLVDAAIFAFAFFTLRLVVSFLMKREAMGSGDIFIAAIIGAVLGIKLGLMAIYIGSLLTLPVYALKKKNYELAFIPFLSLGLLITYVFNNQILNLLDNFYG